MGLDARVGEGAAGVGGFGGVDTFDLDLNGAGGFDGGCAVDKTLAATEVPHKNDVTLPVSELWAFCDELTAFFAMYYPGWEICNFGHIGDGNLHINVLKPPEMTVGEFHQRTNSVDHALFRLVHKHGGSISAEHGIGLLKKEYLPYSRTAAEMAIFRSVKRALDPNGIMNPGKVFDL